MLLHPIINKLQQLNLQTMARCLKEQQDQNNFEELTFEDRLGLLVDVEMTARDA